jgi:hypothetical protein
MTDSEKIADIQKKIHQMRVFQGIVTAVAILGFFGIFVVSDLKKVLK